MLEMQGKFRLLDRVLSTDWLHGMDYGHCLENGLIDADVTVSNVFSVNRHLKNWRASMRLVLVLLEHGQSASPSLAHTRRQIFLWSFDPDEGLPGLLGVNVTRHYSASLPIKVCGNSGTFRICEVDRLKVAD